MKKEEKKIIDKIIEANNLIVEIFSPKWWENNLHIRKSFIENIENEAEFCSKNDNWNIEIYKELLHYFNDNILFKETLIQQKDITHFHKILNNKTKNKKMFKYIFENCNNIKNNFFRWVCLYFLLLYFKPFDKDNLILAKLFCQFELNKWWFMYYVVEDEIDEIKKLEDKESKPLDLYVKFANYIIAHYNLNR